MVNLGYPYINHIWITLISGKSGVFFTNFPCYDTRVFPQDRRLSRLSARKPRQLRKSRCPRQTDRWFSINAWFWPGDNQVFLCKQVTIGNEGDRRSHRPSPSRKLGTVVFLVIPSVDIKNRPRNYGSYVEINYWTMVSGCLITGEGIHGMIRCLWPAVVIVDWDSFHHFSRLVREFLRPTHFSWNSLHVEWSSRRSLHVRLSFFGPTSFGEHQQHFIQQPWVFTYSSQILLKRIIWISRPHP